ncbi:hypothetical protein NDU88_009188 [Pleurodeles waltl]|uniref:Uncharacterized protein n=1 Tax=Pleurodeles waltl TaxID=8319 RepID=A0AAV7P1Q0_PLEWA|nr:hypothetical protein NDU88_009188 [Pleurodeles waltl]
MRRRAELLESPFKDKEEPNHGGQIRLSTCGVDEGRRRTVQPRSWPEARASGRALILEGLALLKEKEHALLILKGTTYLSWLKAHTQLGEGA